MAKYRVQRAPVVQPQDQSYKLIALTKGQVALVSSHRYEALNQYNWQALWDKTVNGFYAVRTTIAGDTIYMHREILHCDSQHGDHENRNTLDNRDWNLRPANPSQSQVNRRRQSNNRSGFKGVNWHKGTRKWRAVAQVKGTQHHLGLFPTKEAAYAAYCVFVKTTWGEFCCLD